MMMIIKPRSKDGEKGHPIQLEIVCYIDGFKIIEGADAGLILPSQKLESQLV